MLKKWKKKKDKFMCTLVPFIYCFNFQLLNWVFAVTVALQV